MRHELAEQAAAAEEATAKEEDEAGQLAAAQVGRCLGLTSCWEAGWSTAEMHSKISARTADACTSPSLTMPRLAPAGAHC